MLPQPLDCVKEGHVGSSVHSSQESTQCDPIPQPGADTVSATSHDNPIHYRSTQAIHNDGAAPQPHSGTDCNLREIFEKVTAFGQYNYEGARVRVPSGLSVEAWRKYLADYPDKGLVDFLEFGWPINFDRRSPLIPTPENHPSAKQHDPDIVFYIDTELNFGALAGPFRGPPVTSYHCSPLMSRLKKDSNHRRVIVDLSWPKGFAVNDGIDPSIYVDGPATVSLPTVHGLQAP